MNGVRLVFIGGVTPARSYLVFRSRWSAQLRNLLSDRRNPSSLGFDPLCIHPFSPLPAMIWFSLLLIFSSSSHPSFSFCLERRRQRFRRDETTYTRTRGYPSSIPYSILYPMAYSRAAGVPWHLIARVLVHSIPLVSSPWLAGAVSAVRLLRSHTLIKNWSFRQALFSRGRSLS